MPFRWPRLPNWVSGAHEILMPALWLNRETHTRHLRKYLVLRGATKIDMTCAKELMLKESYSIEESSK